MTTTEIREALVAIEQSVEVPPVDQAAFQARVQAERRRRTTGRALIGVAAAAAVVTAGVVGNTVLDEPQSAPLADAPGEVAVASVPDTVFFTLDDELTALDPHGEVHDLGQVSEGVIGWTADHVYALDDESHVTVRRAEPPFAAAASPVPGPVQSVALSGDGRYLAWLDLDDQVHRYDLDAGREDVTFAATAGSYVAGVSADGVLVASRSGLSLRVAAGGVAVPLEGDGDGWASDVAGDLVTVDESPERSRLYDLSSVSARLVETFGGSAALGPNAERVAVIVPEPRDRARVEVWDGGTLMPVTGLGDVVPTAVRWADETTLLVQAVRGLYACDVDLRCGRLPVDGEPDLGE
jgi:hypothetical protein